MAKICPYCFSSFDAHEYRCVNARCEKELDVPGMKYRAGCVGKNMTDQELKALPQVVANKCFKSASRAGGAVCPKCSVKSHKRVCPECHNSIPESTISGDDMIISIVGSRNAGKTVFMGVIIHELLNRILVSFGGAMSGHDDSLSRYNEGIHTTMYKEKRLPEMTRSALFDMDNGAYKPLIFTMSFKSKLFASKLKTFTFVFFDTAGEDLKDLDTMSTVARYVAKSVGIIFLVDPLSLSGVRALLDDDVIRRSNPIDFHDANGAGSVIEKVTALIRNERGISQNSKISIPVAAVLSKLDPLAEIFPPGSMAFQPCPHCFAGKFDSKSNQIVSDEISALLQGWGATDFVSQFIAYTKYSFFAVSSLGLGNSPKEGGKIEKPAPHRIEDPLLWLFHENKVIK